MNPTTEDHFREHALSQYPKECCGVVIVAKGKEHYLPCKNIAETPSEHFILDPQDFAKAEDLGEVIAIAHSHVNQAATPSQQDQVMCELTELPWYIVSVTSDATHDLVRMEPCGYKAPLIGRVFGHGVLDCYSLVRDWYAEERGVELPNFERRDGWWDKGENLYLDNFEKCGFEQLPGDVDEIIRKNQLQVGDIILMTIRSPVPNHAAIYVGDTRIVHHMINRLSSRDVYDGYWRENSVMVLRRKEQ